MRKSSILLLAGVVALIGSLVIGPAATAGPERTSAGTVVLIHDQEPPNLQNNWVGNGTLATAYILNNIWYGGEIRDANAAWALRTSHRSQSSSSRTRRRFRSPSPRTRSGATGSR